MAYNNLGNCYTVLNRHGEAIVALEKAVDADTYNMLAVFNLGCAFMKAKRAEDAIRTYQKLLEYVPDSYEAYNNLGMAYYSLRKRP
jgi:tetratricopeptide (TPR) repeat protein